MSAFNRLSRRQSLALLGASGAVPFLPAAAAPTGPEQAWAWLLGSWDVEHSRLKDRLVGSTDWQEFSGKSSLWLTLGGLGTIDDNLIELPEGMYRGLTVRAYDPEARSWSIWWLDGRYPERVDPPVRGRFIGNQGEFFGSDTYKGTPIKVRFRWNDIHSKRPWWEQAFSTDDGKNWEVNWRNYFTRTRPMPSELPNIEGDPPEVRGWDFLRGKWKVHNRLLLNPFVSFHKEWVEFDGTLEAWLVLGGRGIVTNRWNLGPETPSGSVSIGVYGAEKKDWMTWVLDGQDPSGLRAPSRGRFVDGGATFMYEYLENGKPVKVRSRWTRAGTDSIHREDAFSTDGGTNWSTHLVCDFKRA